MIHIKGIHAINIPILTQKLKKTKIYCFSSSSILYFYKSSKSNEKTISPDWNIELDIHLFRCHTLSFVLYSSKKVYIGRLDIDMTSFLSHEEGKQLIEFPNKEIQFKFQIKTSIPTESFLSMSIKYCPVFYPSIKLKNQSISVIHIWASYSPSSSSNYDIHSNPIEICMIQGYTYQKNNCFCGSYSFFNKATIWEPVGLSSQNNYIYGSTGLSQIHSLCLSRINSKFEIFIINVSNYKGSVTLNFVIENKKKEKIINNKHYIVPKIKHPKISSIKTYQITCEPYHKYCFPFCLFCTEENSFQFIDFPLLSMKQNLNSSEVCDIDFNKQIINNVNITFQRFRNIKFFSTNQINNEKISLLDHFTKNNLPVNYNLRIYVGGGLIYYNNEYEHIFYPYDPIRKSDLSSFWDPFFIVYNKLTHDRVKNAEKSLMNQEYHEASTDFRKHSKIFGYKWNSFVKLNLNQFDINQVIIFILFCECEMEYTDVDGFFLISQDNNEYQTFLFRNMIYPDNNNTHYIICFKLEYIEDSWVIFPMRSYYTSKKELASALRYQIFNNRNLPSDISLTKNESNNDEISEKELSVDS